MDNLHQEIYDNVFSKIIKGNIDIFLCGAASTKEKTSYRDLLKNELMGKKRISILYPEDMFMEMLNRKKYDLLTLEKFLADNSDYIIIVCESPGSFTELGAFVNNTDTVEKVLVLLQSKYKNAKSFIRQGPVEHVLAQNKNHVIYYNKDISEAVKNIIKVIQPRGISTKKESYSFKDLNLISGQYNFILLLLYFYKVMPIRELVGYIKTIYESKDYPKENFEVLYSSAVRRLFKEGLISKCISNDNTNSYTLTDKGYENALQLLTYVDLKKRRKVFDDIRMRIIYNGGNN